MFNFSSFFLFMVVSSYTPGPNNIMALSNATRLGFKKSLPFSLGVMSGFVIVMGLCAVFSSVLYSVIPKIKLPMMILGAAYMLYLAWKLFKSSGDIQDGKTNTGYLSGFLLQFVNVKNIIYGITAMSSYILPNFSSPLTIAGFALLMSIVGASGNFCWLIFGSLFKKILVKHSKVVNTVMALLLVYCAVSLFL